ncbi:hypothetical protein F2P81_021503 [Scophthalmus maximus]|uniref:Uncharacterized protein n=1 Tax=Scophthalmus maximus TaxID=52904 RepID=A0A6A4RVI8_SCOMX|nr:hypothetical protein F2P81_021503 [Scophthalmus maximus]
MSEDSCLRLSRAIVCITERVLAAAFDRRRLRSTKESVCKGQAAPSAPAPRPSDAKLTAAALWASLLREVDEGIGGPRVVGLACRPLRAPLLFADIEFRMTMSRKKTSSFQSLQDSSDARRRSTSSMFEVKRWRLFASTAAISRAAASAARHGGMKRVAERPDVKSPWRRSLNRHDLEGQRPNVDQSD